MHFLGNKAVLLHIVISNKKLSDIDLTLIITKVKSHKSYRNDPITKGLEENR